MKVTIVASVYNEQDCLRPFFKSLINSTSKLDCEFEYIFVNDGSRDNSLGILKGIQNKNPDYNIKIISFPRNFGHEAAMICGIDYSSGDCIICMDSDMQHPPLHIKSMLDTFLEGHDLVLMVRKVRIDKSIFYNITAKLFYFIINKISIVEFVPQASDFFLISKDLGQILKENYRERTRFLRGIIQFLGQNRKIIKYRSLSRTAGKSKYSFFKLLLLSFSAIASFSHLPLKLGLLIGGLTGLFSFGISLHSLFAWFKNDIALGFTTIVALNSMMFSILFILIGIIGEYIGFIFDETKHRPIYIVNNTYGVEPKDEK